MGHLTAPKTKHVHCQIPPPRTSSEHNTRQTSQLHGISAKAANPHHTPNPGGHSSCKEQKIYSLCALSTASASSATAALPAPCCRVHPDQLTVVFQLVSLPAGKVGTGALATTGAGAGS